MSAAPENWTPQQWHHDAIADTGTSHVLKGRQYVVQCEWCREAFYAPTKRQAMALFRGHEDEMLTIPNEPGDRP